MGVQVVYGAVTPACRGVVKERQMRNSWKNLILMGALALATLAGAGGCQWLTAYIFADRHPKETIKAEYSLASERLVIIPYASTDVLFSDPGLPMELSRDLIIQISNRLGPEKVKAFINPAEVQRWQEANLEWPNISLVEMGQAFKADTVLYVELERYSLMEEHSANLYRGRVRARIQIVQPAAPHNPVYDTVVETVFPANAPVGVTSASEQSVRTYTNMVFAENVVDKFCDHEIDVKGGMQ
jgi:hypothetical protein